MHYQNRPERPVFSRGRGMPTPNHIPDAWKQHWGMRGAGASLATHTAKGDGVATRGRIPCDTCTLGGGRGGCGDGGLFFCGPRPLHWALTGLQSSRGGSTNDDVRWGHQDGHRYSIDQLQGACAKHSPFPSARDFPPRSPTTVGRGVRQRAKPSRSGPGTARHRGNKSAV